MINIFNEKCDDVILISHSVYNKILYMIILRNTNSYYLICYDLVRRYKVYEKYIIQKFYSDIYIIGNFIYINDFYGKKLYDFCITDAIDGIEEISIKYIVNIDNGPCYLLSINDEHLNSPENCYDLMRDKQKLLTIKLDQNIKFQNNILYVPYMNKIIFMHYDGNIIFYYIDDNAYIKNKVDKTLTTWYIVFNMKTKEIIVNKDLLISDVISPTKVIHEKNGNNYIYDVLNDTNTLLNYELLDFNKLQYFKYNEDDYYICTKNKINNNELLIYIDKKNEYTLNNIKIDDNIFIKIGTNDNNVEMKLNNLLYDSKHIKDLYGDMFNGDTFDLINDAYKHINIYKEYKDSRKINNDEIFELFYICNYLIDCDVNNICEYIIKQIDYVNIDKAFEFLNLLKNSVCDNQLNVLITKILQTFNKNKIIEKMKYVSDDVYSLISKESLIMLLNNFENKNTLL